MTGIDAALFLVGIMSVAALGFALYDRHKRQAQPGSLSNVVRRGLDVHGGDLVFAGTHVPVANLVSYLKGGQTVDEFLRDFPAVGRQQLEAYLELSARATGRILARL